MNGADHRPLGPHLFETSQQELSKASGVLDVPEHGLHHLLPEPITASAASPLQRLGHGAHERHFGQLATARSMSLAMTRPTWRQIALDPALLQGGEVRFRGKTCIA